ncbi:DMT family transporter [Kutzneria sp. 744]|uniref:DMT family transporter n=1 Tax=Kutzneria sp. (strain 744) TaxID=345341 RepID=UPI0018DBF54C|nr:DMT family transporter [Kutzneria sp. 744]
MLVLLLATALWGSATASSKWAVGAAPFEVVAAIRFAAGAVIMLLVVRFTRTATPVARVSSALAGLLGVFVYNALFFWGLSLAPAVDASVIVPGLSPLITAAVSAVTGGQGLSRRRVVALCSALAGTALFAVGAFEGPSAGTDRLLGDLVFLVCAAIWSGYTLLGQRALAGTPPLHATAYGLAAGAVPLLLLSAPAATQVTWSALSAGFWFNMVFLTLGPTCLAGLLYYSSIRDVGAATASVATFLVPVFGAVFATVFLGESVSAVQAVGAVVMLCGSAVAVLDGQAARARKRAEQREGGGHEPARQIG